MQSPSTSSRMPCTSRMTFPVKLQTVWHKRNKRSTFPRGIRLMHQRLDEAALQPWSGVTPSRGFCSCTDSLLSCSATQLPDSWSAIGNRRANDTSVHSAQRASCERNSQAPTAPLRLRSWVRQVWRWGIVGLLGASLNLEAQAVQALDRTSALQVDYATPQVDFAAQQVQLAVANLPACEDAECATDSDSSVAPQDSLLTLSDGPALDVYLDDEGNLTRINENRVTTSSTSSSRSKGVPRASTTPTKFSSQSNTTSSKSSSAAQPSKNKNSTNSTVSTSSSLQSWNLSSSQQAHSFNYGKSILQTGKNQLLVARLDRNYKLEVAAGKLNNIKLPWQSIVADTTSNLALQIRGSSLLVAPHDTQSVVLIVRNQEHPEQTLTLTLQPQSKLESVNLTVVVPELMRDQLFLAQRELNSGAYLGTLTRLMRGMVEQLQAGAIRDATSPYYSLENFEFFAQEVSPEDLEVVELQLDPTTQRQRFPVVAYNCDWGQLQVRSQHLYQPTNLYYANLRFKLVTVVNQSESNIDWSFDDCMPPNVVAASLLDHEHLIPARGSSRLLLLEKLNY